MLAIDVAIDFITRCRTFFAHKDPGPETTRAWAKEIRSIDFDLLSDVFDRFSNLEKWPANYVLKVKELANLARKARPVYEEFAQVGCPDCLGGYLHAWKQDRSLGRWYEYTFICGSCNSQDVRAFPVASQQDLLDRGYRLAWVADEKLYEGNPVTIQLYPGKPGLTVPTIRPGLVITMDQHDVDRPVKPRENRNVPSDLGFFTD